MILITGATGFLGHNLCSYLINQNHQIRALVRSTSDITLLRKLGVEIHVGDIRKIETVQGMVHFPK